MIRGRFTSKLDGMRRAVAFWHCTQCDWWTDTRPDPSQCRDCSWPLVRFPTRIEHERACELMMLQKRGKIDQLKFHPKFDLKVNDQTVCTWTADSQYLDELSGKMVVEDVKPAGKYIDKMSALKIKLFDAIYRVHGLRITIHRRK